ncbi:MAG: nucleoside hydrolase [Alphaproteobacteria bacterium]
MSRKIIIDTDPGQDDAVAILLALASPELEVVGITTVAGNVSVDLTTLNALKIVELAGVADTVPVHRGCDRPLVLTLDYVEPDPKAPAYLGCPAPNVLRVQSAAAVHGATGLEGSDLPTPSTRTRDEHAVDFIIRTVMEAEPGEITLATLAPLTNVAMALRREPRIAERLREIVIMGGAFFFGGNSGPASEWNILVDPHAAHIVFTAGVPITLVPLDCTQKVLTSQARRQKIKDLNSEVARQVLGMIAFYDKYDEDKFSTDGGPLHDACVIGWLLAPDMWSGKDAHVAIETASPLTLGMTVFDWWGVTGQTPNAHVLQDPDADAFYDLLTERLAHYPAD